MSSYSRQATPDTPQLWPQTLVSVDEDNDDHLSSNGAYSRSSTGASLADSSMSGEKTPEKAYPTVGLCVSTSLTGGRPECGVCKEHVADDVLMEAMGQYYHMDCFRCRACNATLPTSFYEHDGQPYCEHDYARLFGRKCNSCHEGIRGLIMSASEKYVYHPECFICLVCQTPIGDSDRYSLIDGSILICGSCSDVPDASPSFTGKSKTRIQLVHVPPDYSGVGLFDLQSAVAPSSTGIRRSFRRRRKQSVKIAKVRRVSLGMPVREGDIIVEVNGKSIKNLSAEEVADMILELQETGFSMTLKRKIGSSRLKYGLSEKFSMMLNRRSSPKSPSSPSRSANAMARKLDSEEKRRVSSATVLQACPSCPGTLSHTTSNTSLGVARYHSAITPDASRVVATDAPRHCSLDSGILSTLSSTRSTVTLRRLSTRSLSGDEEGKVEAGLDDDEGEDKSLEVCSDDDQSETEGCEDHLVPFSSMSRRLQWVKFPTPRRLQTPEVPALPRAYSNDNLSLLGMPHANNSRMQGRRSSHTFETQLLDRNSIFRPGDLEFGSVIGQGFYGQAVRVTNKSDGSVMVMKELVRFDTEAQRNFLKEVALLKSLDHPNVMHFVGIMYRNQKLNLILEYIGGGTLSDRLQEKSIDLPWDLRVSYGNDISAGMEYLHRNKIIHRDLTSHNCLIRLDDTVVVGDFGLAKQSKATQSKYDSVVGSPYWMAPEMMKGLRYDQRADIFSFGIILCEIIGRVSADPEEMPRRHQDFGLDEEEFRREFLGDCPPALFDVAVNCCNTNPLERTPFVTLSLFLGALLNSLHMGTSFTRSLHTFKSRRQSSLSPGCASDTHRPIKSV